MCDEHQFHPGGHCCGESGLCNRWPNINWNKVTWKVTQPDAIWVETRYAIHGYPGSPALTPPAEAGTGNAWAFQGPIASYSNNFGEPTEEGTVLFDVLLSTHDYLMLAGEFVARYSGSCTWTAWTRERCCPMSLALGTVDKGFIWFVSAQNFVNQTIYKEFLRSIPHIDADPITGPFVFGSTTNGTNPLRVGLSWRDVLRSAACSLLPDLNARGLGVFPNEGIEGGLNPALINAQVHNIETQPRVSWYYKPTLMDLMVEGKLSGGFDFGIEPDKRSPYYDQFIITTGGQFAREAPGDPERWCSFTPWQLVSGSEVVAEFGHVNRFERTDDNDCLPRWVELELIPR